MSALSVPGVTDEQLDVISKEVARMQLHGCLSPAAINVDVLAGLIERIRTERYRTDHLLTIYNKAAESLRADEKDAARYRWLRDKAKDHASQAPAIVRLTGYCQPAFDKPGSAHLSLLYGEHAEIAIDAAMEQQP